MIATRKEGARRLLVLAEFLESLPPERFDYRHWVGQDWGGASDLSCGTTACAFGWATAIPEFQALGLKLERIHGQGSVRLDGAAGRATNSDHAAEVFFRLSGEEADWLFYPGQTNEHDEESPGDHATAREVATHIRNFVSTLDTNQPSPLATHRED